MICELPVARVTLRITDLARGSREGLCGLREASRDFRFHTSSALTATVALGSLLLCCSCTFLHSLRVNQQPLGGKTNLNDLKTKGLPEYG